MIEVVGSLWGALGVQHKHLRGDTKEGVSAPHPPPTPAQARSLTYEMRSILVSYLRYLSRELNELTPVRYVGKALEQKSK